MPDHVVEAGSEDDIDMVDTILRTAVSRDIACQVHNWERTPHAHLDADDFLAALEVESEDVRTLFYAMEKVDTSEELGNVLDACGIPWLGADERGNLRGEQREALVKVELHMRDCLTAFRTTGEPRWASFEVMHDVSGPVLHVVSVQATWFVEMSEALRGTMRAHVGELLGSIVGLDEDATATRH